MRCTECGDPMHLAQQDSKVRVFKCNRCGRTKRGVTQGTIVLAQGVGVRKQEQA